MLCTLTTLRRALSQPLSATVAELTTADADDPILRECILRATQMIEAHCRRRLIPQRASLRLNRNVLRGRRVLTAEDFLEVVSVTNGDGTLLATEDYAPYPDDGLTVPYGIELFEGAWSFPEARSRVVISALLGYHGDWTRAFVATGDTLSTTLNAAATTLTVTDIDTSDERGLLRYEVGHLLRLDDELIYVKAIANGTNEMTLTRGVCGTTAASHASGTSLRVFRAMPLLENAATRIALWLYQHRDTATGSVQFLDTGVTLSDRTISDTLRGLDPLIRKAFSVVRA
jgi:hypothetical protein